MEKFGTWSFQVSYNFRRIILNLNHCGGGGGGSGGSKNFWLLKKLEIEETKPTSRQLSNLLLIYKLTDKQKYTTKEDPKEHAHPTIHRELKLDL